MRAVYEGSDVFVWLPSGYGKSEPVLPSAPFPHGLQEGTCRQWKELWCACCEPSAALGPIEYDLKLQYFPRVTRGERISHLSHA